MNSIYLVPTRGRPQNAARLIKAFTDTCRGDTRLVFIIDDDDPQLRGYLEVFTDPAVSPTFGFMVDTRRRLGPTLNYWAPKYAQSYDAVGFMGDDHCPRTEGWDMMLGAYVDVRRNAIVYGNDLVHGAGLPTAVLLGSEIIQALGWMVPPGLIHMYLDNFWKDLGEALGTLTYRPDVIIEHMHPIVAKTEWDEGYTEVAGFMGSDGETYHQFILAQGIVKSVNKICEA